MVHLRSCKLRKVQIVLNLLQTQKPSTLNGTPKIPAHPRALKVSINHSSPHQPQSSPKQSSLETFKALQECLKCRMFFEGRSCKCFRHFFFSSKHLHLKACQGIGVAEKKITGDQDRMSKTKLLISPRWFYEAKPSVLLSMGFRIIPGFQFCFCVFLFVFFFTLLFTVEWQALLTFPETQSGDI